MALKTVNPNVVNAFIPAKEQKEKKPTTIYYRRMSKQDYDQYIHSMTEIKGRKVDVKTEKSAEFLFRKCLAANAKGAFIENAIVDDVETPAITDLEQAVKFLLSLEDIETANEIESMLRGDSTLSEDEAKN